jgi:hypothetical protein
VALADGVFVGDALIFPTADFFTHHAQVAFGWTEFCPSQKGSERAADAGSHGGFSCEELIRCRSLMSANHQWWMVDCLLSP